MQTYANILQKGVAATHVYTFIQTFDADMFIFFNRIFVCRTWSPPFANSRGIKAENHPELTH